MPNLPEKEELQALFPNLEIEYLVAQGGMGAVYRAIQQPLGRAVAIKILPPEFAADKMRKVRFGIEAKAMAKLSHPNIVHLYDFGETEGISWMIQEWIEGKTLHQIGHEGGLPAEEAAALVCQVCAGLGHAHQNGVVHRDVKPANIILNPEGEVKLTDFGLARAVKGGANSLISTLGSCRYGTAEYAAPEVWDEGAVIDHRADIFSLGVLLYESLTGTLPSGVFQQPSEINPSLDPRFDDIIIRSMQAEPQNRYQSCLDFSTAIRQILNIPTSALVEATPALLSTQPISLQPNTTLTAPVSVNTGPNNAMIGKLVLIVVLSALVGFVWKISQDKMAKIDEHHDRADARLAQQLASNEEIKKQIKAEREARKHTGKSQNNQQPEMPSTVPATKAPEITTQKPPHIDGTNENQAPSPSPKQTEILLIQGLNKKLIAKAEPHLKNYDKTIVNLGTKYLEQCKKEDTKAGNDGNLDALLFWQNEATSIRETGEPPKAMTNIPARAETLRKAWHSRMSKKKQPLLKLQKIYLEECSKLITASNDTNKEKIKAHLKLSKKFKNFIKICRGEILE